MSERPTAVRVYLARVRTALADLPAGEIEEILEDVRPHLAEMEAELGADAKVEALIERLGTPESYAAELRSAGGYPPPSEAATTVLPAPGAKAPGLFGPRFALWGLVFCAAGLAMFAFAAAVRVNPDALLGLLFLVPVFALSVYFLIRRGLASVLALPEVEWARARLASTEDNRDGGKALGYLRSLRPAWWLVCALVLVAFGLLLMLRHRYAALLLPFLLVAAVAAVWAGAKVGKDRRLLWVSVPISAFVIGGMLGGFGAAADLVAGRNSYNSGSYHYSNTNDSYGSKQLQYGNDQVGNVYAFDAQGKPLTDVYLYDEEGRPLALSRYACEPGTGSKMRVGADNKFPRPWLDQGVADNRGYVNGYNGYRGVCRERTDIPFSAAIPKGTTPSPSPGAPTSSAPAAPSSSAPATAPATPPSSPPPATR
ncbi:HAAS signaling domain-containing protein [Amycolatopsis sp. NPDC059021]|uniref:HAAS signaling domain-containing protein n=1 Tax=Amycolatopsis sp. NPDC059021 TaxID=3346704 RepID=UPI00366B3731